ncbi:hypothetical protein AKJ57_03715 [candidate division MSBL1 archaeon SCGC-AAA259A05]|uniref:Uncharacterized protein n=1 Tax=candidate division MSBL1 archaeon SCGC-AAA259A05 TaxID=1698259 RepID=A0A133U9E1_9EURY|nr:hypothetical protein AKJ57_03715 [candidate division MSBL1 archaeon SCGC-AAA259A05]
MCDEREDFFEYFQTSRKETELLKKKVSQRVHFSSLPSFGKVLIVLTSLFLAPVLFLLKRIADRGADSGEGPRGGSTKPLSEVPAPAPLLGVPRETPDPFPKGGDS